MEARPLVYYYYAGYSLAIGIVATLLPVGVKVSPKHVFHDLTIKTTLLREHVL